MIVLFGSINVDLAARTARLPRAGETQAGQAYAMLPGGKRANQALAARRAGAQAALHDAIAIANLSATVESNLAFQPLD